MRPEEKETLCCVFLPLLNFEDVMHEIPLKPTNTQFYLDNHSITIRPAVKSCILCRISFSFINMGAMAAANSIVRKEHVNELIYVMCIKDPLRSTFRMIF